MDWQDCKALFATILGFVVFLCCMETTGLVDLIGMVLWGAQRRGRGGTGWQAGQSESTAT